MSFSTEFLFGFLLSSGSLLALIVGKVWCESEFKGPTEKPNGGDNHPFEPHELQNLDELFV
jgi:hypothetical protein